MRKFMRIKALKAAFPATIPNPLVTVFSGFLIVPNGFQGGEETLRRPVLIHILSYFVRLYFFTILHSLDTYLGSVAYPPSLMI